MPLILPEIVKKKFNVTEYYKLPKEVNHCKICVISNQRPRITFNDEGKIIRQVAYYNGSLFEQN